MVRDLLRDLRVEKVSILILCPKMHSKRSDLSPSNTIKELVASPSLIKIFRIARIGCDICRFDKEGAPLWKIGETKSSLLSVKTVLFAKNEVIVCVVAKLYSREQSMYSDF
jgi:hypothetical protein